jgi:hypothetical protein
VLLILIKLHQIRGKNYQDAKAKHTKDEGKKAKKHSIHFFQLFMLRIAGSKDEIAINQVHLP